MSYYILKKKLNIHLYSTLITFTIKPSSLFTHCLTLLDYLRKNYWQYVVISLSPMWHQHNFNMTCVVQENLQNIISYHSCRGGWALQLGMTIWGSGGCVVVGFCCCCWFLFFYYGGYRGIKAKARGGDSESHDKARLQKRWRRQTRATRTLQHVLFSGADLCALHRTSCRTER